MEPILEIKNLTVAFNGFPVLRNLNLPLYTGETLCLVGESGSGKSMTALSILNLIPPAGKITTGNIFFQGKDLLALQEKELNKYRGRDIAMIFQEPMTSLNPVFTVGYQIQEVLTTHLGLSKKEADGKIIELMEQVGIPDPKQRINDYPFQFSGGMRQRVMIAMALACSPQIILADEPTTALDITMQGQILTLLKTLSTERKLSVMLITHDLGVVAEAADRVAVMYAGEILEYAPAAVFFRNPLHPYSAALKSCVPLKENYNSYRLPNIIGSVPAPYELDTGCSFRARCSYADNQCQFKQELKEIIPGHFVRCHRAFISS